MLSAEQAGDRHIASCEGRMTSDAKHTFLNQTHCFCRLQGSQRLGGCQQTRVTHRKIMWLKSQRSPAVHTEQCPVLGQEVCYNWVSLAACFPKTGGDGS